MAFFGLVAVGGTYFVQGSSWSSDALLAGAGLGALSTAILVVNNLRDIGTDAAVGKRTLAVRLGAAGTKVEYVLLLLVGAAVPIAGVLSFSWPTASLVSLLALLVGVRPLRTVLGYADPRELIPALGGTARVVALYGGLLALGLGLG